MDFLMEFTDRIWTTITAETVFLWIFDDLQVIPMWLSVRHNRDTQRNQKTYQNVYRQISKSVQISKVPLKNSQPMLIWLNYNLVTVMMMNNVMRQQTDEQTQIMTLLNFLNFTHRS